MCPFTVRVPIRLSLAVFLGGMLTRTLGSPRRDRRTIRLQLGTRASLRPSTPKPFNPLIRQRAALSLPRHRIARKGSTGILTRQSIGFAARLSLRPRLTLIRLALIRKPWSFGEGVSHPLYRYLYLHLLFQTLQSTSRCAFDADWNAPLPIHTDPGASAVRLYPIIIHAGSLDQ